MLLLTWKANTTEESSAPDPPPTVCQMLDPLLYGWFNPWAVTLLQDSAVTKQMADETKVYSRGTWHPTLLEVWWVQKILL